MKATVIPSMDPGEIGRKWVLELEPPIARIVAEAGAQGVLDAGGMSAFNVYDPRVRGFIAARNVQITTVAAGHVEDVRRVLGQGYEAGDTLRDLIGRVNEWQDMADWKAERIARTEVGAAANEGALVGYQQAGATHKEWIATRDSRTRDGHAALDGKVIGIDEDFTDSATGATGPGPGLMSLAASVINCRCALAPADAPE